VGHLRVSAGSQLFALSNQSLNACSIEQPLAPADHDGHRQFARASEAPDVLGAGVEELTGFCGREQRWLRHAGDVMPQAKGSFLNYRTIVVFKKCRARIYRPEKCRSYCLRTAAAVRFECKPAAANPRTTAVAALCRARYGKKTFSPLKTLYSKSPVIMNQIAK
jgi:hypothetical protein